MIDPRRSIFTLACAALAWGALGWGAAGHAQGTRAFPPVPGPFLVAPSMPTIQGGPGAAMRSAPSAMPGPNFAPPANAMRLPYWMQPGASGQTEQPATAGVTEAPPTAGEPAAPTRGQTAAVGYGQATAPGAFPGYAATAPWAGQGQPFNNGAPQGYGQPPQGYGYGGAPGWAAQPYSPGPGWGGWAGPGAGAGN